MEGDSKLATGSGSLSHSQSDEANPPTARVLPSSSLPEPDGD